MLKKLDIVDTKRFKRGVDMDVKMQLLTIALKKDAKDNLLLTPLIEKAIDDAGYVAVEWYTLEKEKLTPHPFKPESKKK
ncbi:MAG TPA: hypothetical protein EYQ62_01425 [Verrucomicrobiales bacterium]|jgi:hypothetical protein|nr:hypothetical protein [Verrucomicrobiales bacterium]